MDKMTILSAVEWWLLTISSISPKWMQMAHRFSTFLAYVCGVLGQVTFCKITYCFLGKCGRLYDYYVYKKLLFERNRKKPKLDICAIEIRCFLCKLLLSEYSISFTTMNSIGDDNTIIGVTCQVSGFWNNNIIYLILQKRNVVLLWRNVIGKIRFTLVKCHILIVIIYTF